MYRKGAKGSLRQFSNAEHRDVIDNFLGYFLDYETQRRYCTDRVRKTVKIIQNRVQLFMDEKK